MRASVRLSINDGFEELPALTSQLVHQNISVLTNEVSPFSTFDQRVQLLGDGFLIDKFFGQVYETNRELPRAFYGLVDELPSYSGDDLSDRGWLRVPFRRIPRVSIKNRTQLLGLVNGIASADPNLRLLFRGQQREHYLSRSPEVRELLYGDSTALEPSLLPSAARAGLALENVAPEWGIIVQLFLHMWQQHLLDKGWSEATLLKVKQDLSALSSGYQFWVFLLALAQHYGLPSAGLDVTSNLDVALFFALMEFRPDPQSEATLFCQRPTTVHEWPVIYLLSNYDRFIIDFSKVRPTGLPFVRPDAQAAHFLHTGWGFASNAVARTIFLALYLDPSGDWPALPSPASLFPTPDKDAFGSFVFNSRAWPVSDQFKNFISRFYWVRS